MLIVVTGTIASGKSSVTERLSRCGIEIMPTVTDCVIDAEKNHELTHTDGISSLTRLPALNKIEAGSAMRTIPLSDTYHRAAKDDINAVIALDPSEAIKLKETAVSQGYDPENVKVVLINCDFRTSVKRLANKQCGITNLTEYQQQHCKYARLNSTKLAKQRHWDLVVANNDDDYGSLEDVANQVATELGIAPRGQRPLWAIG